MERLVPDNIIVRNIFPHLSMEYLWVFFSLVSKKYLSLVSYFIKSKTKDYRHFFACSIVFRLLYKEGKDLKILKFGLPIMSSKKNIYKKILDFETKNNLNIYNELDNLFYVWKDEETQFLFKNQYKLITKLLFTSIKILLDANIIKIHLKNYNNDCNNTP
jgi:hypothetical protein